MNTTDKKFMKNPCSNPTPHEHGSLPCCAGLIMNTTEKQEQVRSWLQEYKNKHKGVQLFLKHKGFNESQIDVIMGIIKTGSDEALATQRESMRKEFRQYLLGECMKSQLECEFKYGDGTGNQEPGYEKVVNKAISQYSTTESEKTL